MKAPWNLLTLMAAILAGGCGTQPQSVPGLTAATPTQAGQSDVQTLREGDTIKISFPGASSLDVANQQIRPDGRISMTLIGEVYAAGLKPAELEKLLEEKYASQLRSNDVKVEVLSSSFSVYVSGAVLKPGKIATSRPLTVLEGVMEAGGFDETKANKKKVKVLRMETNGRPKIYSFNVEDILNGKSTAEPFFLRPYDTIIVDEKFKWF